MTPKDQPLSPEEIAERSSLFVKGELGQLYLGALSAVYNQYHHKAEDEELSIEKKALYVERAAGVKVAIDWLMERTANHERGMFKKPATPATTKSD